MYEAIKAEIERQIDKIVDENGFILKSNVAQYTTLRDMMDFIESLDRQESKGLDEAHDEITITAVCGKYGVFFPPDFDLSKLDYKSGDTIEITLRRK